MGADKRMRRILQRLTDSQNAFLLIITIAFALRIYRLDTPSMWGDEIFGPVIASKPLDYLLRWNWLEDVHPPTFYFFMKLVLLASSSDFALRLPSVALGVLSVYLIHRVGRTWLGEQGGLLAASFLTVSFAHIYLSRVVRFYSFTIVLCLLGIMLLTQFMERRDRKSLAWFTVVLGALLLAEFTSIMPILGLGVAMLAVILAGQDRLRLLCSFTVYGLAAFAVPGFFLLATTLQRKGFAGIVTSWDALYNYLNALSWLSTGLMHRPYGHEYWIVGFTAVVALVGAVRLAFTGRRLLGICLSIVLCSLFVILCIRPGYMMAFWHLFYIIPILALLEASAVQAVLPAKYWTPVAIGISLASAALLLGPFDQRFYASTSFGSDIREVGRAASEVAPGTVTLQDPMSIDFVNWYADQYSLENRFKEQYVSADTTPLTVNIFMEEQQLGHLVSPQHPVSSWAEVVKRRPLGMGEMVQAVVKREPLIPLDMSGATRVLHAHPGDFYRFAHTAERVMIDPYWSNTVIPTVNERTSAFTYRFVNPDDTGSKYIVLNVQYRNKGKHSVFKAWTQFDNEAPVEWVDSIGPESPNHDLKSDNPQVERSVSLRRERPFKTLTVGFDLSSALITPHYPTSNLVKTGFKRLFIAARPYGPDLMDEFAFDPDIELEGFKGVEREGDRSWRWALGTRNSISFTTESATPMRLTYAMVSPMKNQGYALTVNGEQVGGETGMPAQQWTDDHPVKVLEFTSKPGRNTVAFQFQKINHVNDSFSETDSSPYAAAFKLLRLEPAPSASAQPQ